MRRTLHRLGTAAALLTMTTAALTGCGDNSSEGTDDPTPTEGSTSSAGSTDETTDAGDDLCHVISDEDLSGWTDTRVTVNDQDVDGTTTTCETVVDAGDPTYVSWTVSKSAGSLDKDVELNRVLGVKSKRIELPAGGQAELMAGTSLGQRIAVVVAPTAGAAGDGNVVIAQALNPSGMDKVEIDKLATIASNVANAYTS